MSDRTDPSSRLQRVAWSILGSVILCSSAHADERSYDPALNVCRGTSPVCYHDWAAAQRKGNRVLLYTRTAAFRHPNLGPALAAGLNPPLGPDNVVQTALKDWLEKEGIAVDWTEDVVAFANAKLNQYKAIIFASTSRDALWAHGRAIDPQFAVNTSTGAHLDAARTALRQYIRAGGGFVGVHSAVGTEYNWSWYEGLLGNSNFYDHGPFQAGTVIIRTRTDPSTNGLPQSWPPWMISHWQSGTRSIPVIPDCIRWPGASTTMAADPGSRRWVMMRALSPMGPDFPGRPRSNSSL
jgi:trehalose utilization protein